MVETARSLGVSRGPGIGRGSSSNVMCSCQPIDLGRTAVYIRSVNCTHLGAPRHHHHCHHHGHHGPWAMTRACVRIG